MRGASSQTAKYHLGVDKDGQKRFAERATEMAAAAGWAGVRGVLAEAVDDSHLIFRFTGAPAAPATPSLAGGDAASSAGSEVLTAAAEGSAKAPADAEAAAAVAGASSSAGGEEGCSGGTTAGAVGE